MRSYTILLRLILLVGSSVYLSGYTGCGFTNKNSESAESHKKALQDAAEAKKRAEDRENATKYTTRERVKELARLAEQEERDKLAEQRRVQELLAEKAQLEAEVQSGTAASQKAARKIARTRAKKVAAEQAAANAQVAAQQAATDAQAAQAAQAAADLAAQNAAAQAAQDVNAAQQKTAAAQAAKVTAEAAAAAAVAAKGLSQAERINAEAKAAAAKAAQVSAEKAAKTATDQAAMSKQKAQDAETKAASAKTKAGVSKQKAQDAEAKAAKAEADKAAAEAAAAAGGGGAGGDAVKDLEEEIKVLKEKLAAAGVPVGPKGPKTPEFDKKTSDLLQDDVLKAQLSKLFEKPVLTDSTGKLLSVAKEKEAKAKLETEQDAARKALNPKLDEILKTLNDEVGRVDIKEAMKVYEDLVKAKDGETPEQKMLRDVLFDQLQKELLKSPHLNNAQEAYNEKVSKDEEKHSLVERLLIYDSMFDPVKVDLVARSKESPILGLFKRDREELKKKLKNINIARKMADFSKFASSDELKALWAHLMQGGISPKKNPGVFALADGIRREIEDRKEKLIQIESDAYKQKLIKELHKKKAPLMKSIAQLEASRVQTESTPDKPAAPAAAAPPGFAKPSAGPPPPPPPPGMPKGGPPPATLTKAQKLAQIDANLLAAKNDLGAIQAEIDNVDNFIVVQKKQIEAGKKLAEERDALVKSKGLAEAAHKNALTKRDKTLTDLKAATLQQADEQKTMSALQAEKEKKGSWAPGKDTAFNAAKANFDSLSAAINAYKLKLNGDPSKKETTDAGRGERKLEAIAEQNKKDAISRIDSLKFPSGDIENFAPNDDYIAAGYTDVAPVEKKPKPAAAAAPKAKDAAYFAGEAEDLLTELDTLRTQLKGDNESRNNIDEELGKKKHPPLADADALFTFLDSIALKKEDIDNQSKLDSLEALVTAVTGLYKSNSLLESKLNNLLKSAKTLGLI